VPKPASGVPAGFAFFLLPVLLICGAVGLRTLGMADSWQAVMDRVARYAPLADRAARDEGVPLPLVLAVVSTESGGRAEAVSSADAVGLMQLRAGTAQDMARARSEPEPVLTDPATSLRLGTRYLALQLRRFEGRPRGRELALAAYNAGPARVTEWIAAEEPPEDIDEFVRWVPFAETQGFVRRVGEWEVRWRRYLARPPLDDR
jgi:soluble lytic murein transglycosylase